VGESVGESVFVSVFEFVFEFVFEGGWREGRGETERGDDRRGVVPRFDHHRLDAFSVAREALGLGDGIARRLPRGYATLADQLRRALLSAYLGIAEASSRSGSDRLARFRCARGEASEAAAALEAVQLLQLAPAEQVDTALALLDRLCAMLTRLAGLGRPPR
jgi:four helix bundle protein